MWTETVRIESARSRGLSPRRIRQSAAWVFICVLVGSAAWAGTGEITGTIVDDVTKLPLSGMCVEAYGLVTGEVESAPTGDDGAYSLTGLDPDRFQLVAFDCVPPIDHGFAEHKSRRKSLRGAHSSTDGARLVRLTRDGQVKSRVDFNMPAAGHIAATVVHDATGLPAPEVIVVPRVFPQPRRGSIVLSGFFGTADDMGQLSLDVDSGSSDFVALAPHSSTSAVAPPVDVAPAAVLPVEIRVPW